MRLALAGAESAEVARPRARTKDFEAFTGEGRARQTNTNRDPDREADLREARRSSDRSFVSAHDCNLRLAGRIAPILISVREVNQFDK